MPAKFSDHEPETKAGLIRGELRTPHFLQRRRPDQTRTAGQQRRGESREVIDAGEKIPGGNGAEIKDRRPLALPSAPSVGHPGGAVGAGNQR